MGGGMEAVAAAASATMVTRYFHHAGDYDVTL